MPCKNRHYQEQHHASFGCHNPVWRRGARFVLPEPDNLFAHFLQEHTDNDAAFHLAHEGKARTSDDEKAHVVQMDVPGVKSHHISIEEKNGEIEIAGLRMNNGEDGEEVAKVYQEVFYLNPFQFDIDQAKATLTNGVLTLRIPKNNQATMKKTIPVESVTVPSDLPSSNLFLHTLDLPGVSASSLEVKLEEDRVSLTGKRTLGDKRVMVQRGFEVPPSMDTLQARALLQDGVFTFLAPIHEIEEGHLRTIIVEDEQMMEMESSAAIAQMKITSDEENNSNNIKNKEDETMNVETVDEDSEAKETESWEKVSSEEKIRK